MSSLKLYGSTSGYVEVAPEATAQNNSVTIPNTTGTIAVKDASGNLEVGTGVTIAAPSSNTYTVSTNGSERLRISSSGNIGIGTDNPGYKLDLRVNTNDVTTGSPNSDSFLQIRADDATVGYGPSLVLSNFGGSKETAWRISAVSTSGNNGDLVFNGYAGGATYPEAARFTSAGNLKFPSGQGIDFSATADGSGTVASELLDDYEEGTWTPIASASSGTITSYTSSGRYTKIGRIVTLHFAITISNEGTANGQYLLWSGAPFTASNTINQMGVGREMNVNGYLSSCLIQGNATNGGFYRWDNSGVIVNGNFQAVVVYNVD